LAVESWARGAICQVFSRCGYDHLKIDCLKLLPLQLLHATSVNHPHKAKPFASLLWKIVDLPLDCVLGVQFQQLMGDRGSGECVGGMEGAVYSGGHWQHHTQVIIDALLSCKSPKHRQTTGNRIKSDAQMIFNFNKRKLQIQNYCSAI